MQVPREKKGYDIYIFTGATFNLWETDNNQTITVTSKTAACFGKSQLADELKLEQINQQQKFGYIQYPSWSLVLETYELPMWAIASISGLLHVLQPVGHYIAKWS